MENQTLNIQELEALRGQVAEFKNRLEKQEIVSERLLRKSMRSQMGWVWKINYYMSFVGLALVPIVALSLLAVRVSWPPVVFISVLLTAEAVYNFLSTRPLRKQRVETCALMTLSRQLVAYKRRERWQMLIEVPLLVAWSVWIVLDLSHVSFGTTPMAHGLHTGIVWGAAVGAGLGMLIAFWMFSKEMRKINQLIRDIEEFTAEE